MSILTSNLKLEGSGGTACAVSVTLKDKHEKPMKYVLKITIRYDSLIYEYMMGLHINALMAQANLDCFIHTHALYYGTMQFQVDSTSKTMNVLDNFEPTNMIRLYEANISGNFSIDDLCNSIAVQGSVETKLQQIIQLDFASGYTLETILDKYTASLDPTSLGPTSLAGNSILEILFQAYIAIYMLQGHFVHGDLNIGNILISDIPKDSYKHSIKIIDYGTCKIPESFAICKKITEMDEKTEPCYNVYKDVCVTYDIPFDNNWVDLLYVVALKDVLADKKYSALQEFLGIPVIDYTVWATITDPEMKVKKTNTYIMEDPNPTISTVEDMYNWINQKYSKSLP
jgi:hypothetical protein